MLSSDGQRPFFNVATGALFVGLFLILAMTLRSQQNYLIPNSELAAQFDNDHRLRPLSEVVETIRDMKLVTVIINSTVKKEMRDEIWRGSASVTVEAPVRYIYGVDLSQLEPDAIQLTLLDMYRITIPEPGRIAVDIDASQSIHEVNVTGTRFKALSGNSLLAAARREIYIVAQNSVLPQEKMDEIRTMTRNQVETLVQRILGQKKRIEVRFRRIDHSEQKQNEVVK